MVKRILLLLGCVVLLAISWRAVLQLKSPSDKQELLIESAKKEMNKGTYANAAPYLIEAINHNAKYTIEALVLLKDVYVDLGSVQNYVDTLKQLTLRTDCPTDFYGELARYYINQNRLGDALNTLKLGIERTNEDALITYYEDQRYAYTIKGDVYDDVTTYHSSGIQIKSNGLWGLANAAGEIIIPCEYDQISTYDTANKGCVVALKSDNKPAAINLSNQIIALFDSPVKRIGNLSQNIVPLQMENDKWIIADSKFTTDYTEYDDIGISFNNAIAVKRSDKWGVSASGKTLIPYEYDEIVWDELRRCLAQKAVFAKKDGLVYLFVNGKPLVETYEDARPFTDDGWAAVKKNGKWGFINTSGEIMIDYQFEDALSFSQHLAAVKVSINEEKTEQDGRGETGRQNGQTEHWGYISLYGKIVIEPVFLQAKSFAYGYAPVLTDKGWQFLSLTEYR